VTLEGPSHAAATADGVVHERRAPHEPAHVAARELDRFLVDHAHIAIFRADETGRIVYANQAAQTALGYALDELVRMHVWNINTELDAQSWRARIRNVIEHGAVHVEGQLRARDGTIIPFDLSIHRLIVDGRNAFVAYALDASRLKGTEQRMEQLANFDALTGLPNRTLLQDRLQQALQRAQAAHSRVAVFHVDLDQFKLINDSLGHRIGDEVLEEAACRLQETVGTSETVARVGADEFVLFLSGSADMTDDVLALTARRIMDAFGTPVVVDEHEIYVKCSIGVATYPRDARSVDALLRGAEAAMHEAKRSGRNSARFHTAESDTRARALLGLEAALRRANDRGELSLSYQPQVDLATGAIVGVEALLRWQHPTLGAVPPDRFIRLAEESGLIVPMGEWVLRTACRQAAEWQARGLPKLRMGVNISAIQLRTPDFAPLVQEVLRETGLDADQLQLELTESVLMQDADSSAAALRKLRDLGVEAALDDFGTGYSSLSYLKRFPLDVVKIDKAFVQDVTAAPEDTSIARAIVNMARALRLKSVAEGVETAGQVALLLAHGCDRLQGFFFSPPISGDAFVDLVRSGRRLEIDALRMSGRRRTLLIVDDEPNILSAIGRLLRRDGYTILTANSAATGLETLARSNVDVIISDQRMPGMTGVEFLRRAKDLFPDTVRIVLSGFTELSSVADAINEGAIYKFLAKPWDDETLRQHVAEAFRYREQSDEARKLNSAAQVESRELAHANVALQNLVESQKLTMLHEATTLELARTALDAMPMPIVAIGPVGTIVVANGPARTRLGVRADPSGPAAVDVLPDGIRALLLRGDGATACVAVDGTMYEVTHRTVQGTAARSGSLLCFAVMASGVPG